MSGHAPRRAGEILVDLHRLSRSILESVALCQAAAIDDLRYDDVAVALARAVRELLEALTPPQRGQP